MFTMNGQTLYFSNAKYNLTLIIKELEKIVLNEGGNVKPAYHNGYIINRSFLEAAQENENHAARLEELTASKYANDPAKVKKWKTAAANLKAEAEELRKKAEESTAEASHTGYIIFTLNGFYYSIDFNDNVFEDFYYTKTPIKDGNRISRDTYREKLIKSWFHNCFYSLDDAKPELAEDRKEAANIIFNIITAAPACEVYRETYRKRVQNYYNSGYHYETLTKPERIEKLTF